MAWAKAAEPRRATNGRACARPPRPGGPMGLARGRRGLSAAPQAGARASRRRHSGVCRSRAPAPRRPGASGSAALNQTRIDLVADSDIRTSNGYLTYYLHSGLAISLDRVLTMVDGKVGGF